MIPVVFLHGFLGTRDEWRPCVDRLTQGEPRCLDLPTADNWEGGLHAVRSQLPPGALLVGYSMGARIALGCALAAEEWLSGLVFISGNPGLTEAEKPSRRAQDQSVRKALMTCSTRDFLEAWYSQPIFASSPESSRREWIKDRESLDRQRQHDLLRCYSIADQPSYWPQLPSLHLPTWIVTGEEDTKYRDLGRAMQAAAPQLQRTSFEKVGHAVHREAPAQLAQLLDKIIETLTTGECSS